MGLVKEALRDLASRALVASGATAVGRRVRDRDGTLILYGHRVQDDDEGYLQGCPPAWFRDQVAYLARHYEVIPLSTLVECLEERRPPPPRSVVLTLDDGFRDNVEQALPILEDLGVRATVFVVTQSLSDGRLPWAQRLAFMFQRTAVASLQHELVGHESVALTTPGERRGAYDRVKRSLAPLPREQRDAHITAIADALEVEPPLDRMMDWDHARAALASGHEIGAHTYSHALLAAVPPDEARSEMLRSKADLEEHLGIRRATFCFPGGSTNRELCGVARDLGFRSAFLPDPSRRLNRAPDVDAFSMVRVGIPNAPAHHLEAELEGPFHTLRAWAGRHARRARR